MLWAAPATLFFIAFGIAPCAVVGYLSLTRWNGLSAPQWIGLDNWRGLVADPDAGHGVRITLMLAALCWLVQTPISLLLGVWAAGAQRIRAVASTLFVLPLLLSTASIALVWLALLDPNFGLPSTLARYVGLADGNLLGSPQRALYVVALVISWQFVPFHALIYQGAARQIPATLYEAAHLDGAGTARQFYAITLPQLRNTIVASSVLIIVGSLTFFESVLMLTRGGPGTATRILPVHMYIKGFVGFEMGYASALALLLVAVGTMLSVAIVWATGYHRMASQREGL
jgi:xylobiose transport system permease protein